MTRPAAGNCRPLPPPRTGITAGWIYHAWQTSRLISFVARRRRPVSRLVSLARQGWAAMQARILAWGRASVLLSGCSGIRRRSGAAGILQQQLLPLGSAAGVLALLINIWMHAARQAFVPYPVFQVLALAAAGSILYSSFRLSESPGPARWQGQAWFWGLALAAGAVAGMLSCQENYQVIVALALVLWLAGLAWQKPILGLWLFLLLLPLHHLLMTVLSQQMLVVKPALVALKAWKDAIILALAVKSAWLLFTRKAEIRWSALDLLLLAFLALNAMHALWPKGPGDWQASLQGLRVNVYFVLCFYFGRIFAVQAVQIRAVLKGLVILGAVAALAAMAEKIFGLAVELPAWGYVDYLKTAFNQTFPTPYGLPFTYWIEGKTVWRTGSFFLGPLDLSYALLLIIPATTVCYLSEAREKKRRLLLGALGLQLLAAGLALSRSALAALAVELAVMAWYGRNFRQEFLRALAVAAIVFTGLFGLYHQELHVLLARTAALQEDSTAGHVEEWKQGIESMQNQWLGTGLGTKGFAGSRAQKAPGGENQYLILGMELGLAGLVLFVCILAGILLQLGKIISRPPWGLRRRLALAVAACMLGLGLVGLTSQVYLNNFAVFLCWWLAGWTQNVAATGGQHADWD